MKPLVSIVIPVYNHQAALERALVSISGQSYQNIEIIIVDDGSTPPIQIANRQVIRQENAGAPAARNRGLEEAKGEYVIFWDADIIAVPTMLEKMVHALESDKDAAFAYSNFHFGKKKFPSKAFDLLTLQQTNCITTTSLIRRSKAIKWDESLKRFQDWDYYLTLAEQGKKGAWIDEYLFTIAPGGTMSSWLPAFAYKKPWSLLPGIAGRVAAYKAAEQVVRKKHNI